MRQENEKASIPNRVGHLLRINSYMDGAILSMWMNSPRAPVVMGMVEASVRHEGPGGKDEEFLKKLRGLISEAREFHASNDFPPAMSRMRVAHDLIALYIIRLAETQN